MIDDSLRKRRQRAEGRRQKEGKEKVLLGCFNSAAIKPNSQT
jgi:hypothetical protein